MASAVIALPDGKTFTVKARGLNDRNIYIQSMTLNGKPLDDFFIDHTDIIAGGELIFNMGARPLNQ